ncbi:MAG: methyltransferase domain-containing protein [Alphaproteobacteria bacterium]
MVTAFQPQSQPQSQPLSPPQVFNRNLVRLHRDRAARMISNGTSDDFLYVELANRLNDCLEDVKRSFPRVLDLGCRAGTLWPLVKQRCGQDLYLQADPSAAMVSLARQNGNPSFVVEEEALAIGDEQFDLILCGGGLHWVNDLPGTLMQIRKALKPDGLFLGVCISGATLADAEHVMLQTETDLSGGVSPRFSPSFDLKEATGLLQRAGFALPVGDLQTLTVDHSHPFKLMQDLRAMGETNAHTGQLKHFSPRNLLPTFASNFMDSQNENGRIATNFDLMFLSGWAPHASQQQAPKPDTSKFDFSLT